MADLSESLPPAYEIAQVPTEVVTYVFSPEGFNTLLLLPPSTWPDSRPQYHIAVALNVWNPFSYITTVRKGATDSAPVVGEFEMGISTLPGTVSMGGITKFISETLQGREWSKFIWRFNPDHHQHLRWEWATSDPGLFHCFLGNVKVAQYQGPTMKRRPKTSALTVYPAGQKYFDDIVLSILICERMRLRPPAPRGKSLLDDNVWWS
ncbi:hypothetical protein C8F01DRAFT_1100278 [Mycena amicta]|nr:hypothetical protein C8F01DRAFT_1100278 [Mycena amicta]